MEKLFMRIASFLWITSQFFTRLYETADHIHSAKMEGMTLVEYHENRVNLYRRRYWKASEFLTTDEKSQVVRESRESERRIHPD